jgi:serine/threonine-protein kinase HipA
MKPLIEKGEIHSHCAKKLFGESKTPEIPYDLQDLDSLASQILKTSTAITGVQKKLSLHMSWESERAKLTFVGLWGNYILKPPVEHYRELPENELLTMKLAGSLKIQTVPHGLIRLRSGETAYITRRIDRKNNGKIPMEDFCQLSEKMTEDKYRGSAEQAGKIVLKYCANRMFDALRLFELVLFNFLVGNGDMHLKNYSLIGFPGSISLAPAYDLLNTRLVISERDDPDETALSINGKRRKLKVDDFIQFGVSLGLTEKQMNNVLKRFAGKKELLQDIINNSFLSDEYKESYRLIFIKRWERIFRP